MGWKEKKLVTFLSTLLLILVVANLLALSMRYRENREEQAAEPTVAVTGVSAEEHKLTTLEYHNGEFMLSFTLGENGKWVWDVDDDFPLDDTTIQEILAILANWAPQQALPAEQVIENSGLSDSDAYLTASYSNGTAATLSFGKTTTDGNSYYTRWSSDEDTVWNSWAFGKPSPEPEEPEEPEVEVPEEPASPSWPTELSRNSDSESIRMVQVKLYELGMIDQNSTEIGVLDSSTLQAIAGFQQRMNENHDAGLIGIDPSNPDSVIDFATLSALYNATIDSM